MKEDDNCSFCETYQSSRTYIATIDRKASICSDCAILIAEIVLRDRANKLKDFMSDKADQLKKGGDQVITADDFLSWICRAGGSQDQSEECNWLE